MPLRYAIKEMWLWKSRRTPENKYLVTRDSHAPSKTPDTFCNVGTFHILLVSLCTCVDDNINSHSVLE